MPSILSNWTGESVSLVSSDKSPYEPPHQTTADRSPDAVTNAKGLVNGNYADGSAKGQHVKAVFYGESDGVNASLQSLPKGRSSDSMESNRDRSHFATGSNHSMVNGYAGFEDACKHGHVITNGNPKPSAAERPPPQGPAMATKPAEPKTMDHTHEGHAHHRGHTRAHSLSAPQVPQGHSASPPRRKGAEPSLVTSEANSPAPPTTSLSVNRLSSPPALPNTHQPPASSSSTSLHPLAPRLHHRHTLEVPRLSTNRTSRDFSLPITPSDGGSESGHFSPTSRTPRASSNLVRAPSRSIHSDMYLDEIPQDGDMARWTETIRQKRASRRKRKEEEEDDRVVVGTKVDMNHVNWVTAYNMLTGIRFTVSRTNAKIDRDLTMADFDAKHKFSFDITGNELTPSAKYDFKFKDYAPWVFRRLRAKFQLDPADYLMSLTSKYILSELGSPGKSGSFFYFSRDYKYIIKTIHHAEHKLLRKILRDYYAHIEQYPNTLISQFYGLHRVKIPYGRKIHFVVMNNLFPPHRDIHQTFDLKGSTIGRDFKEEDLEKNPRATLKDLNWLRRNNHFEFGPEKKNLFIHQMKQDVSLLQRLKIMDYSLLVGIHDLGKGNEENLRDKTLQVFQPGGDEDVEPQVKMLTRTPSKLENARHARQLREIIKKERPVPIDQSTNRMPDEMLEERKNFTFYSDDGGFRATHEDGQPGEEIYYLGIIDCLTHYGFVKRAETLWKGMSNNKALISPIPPEAYGDRFVKFISGLTMTKEAVGREAQSEQLDGSVHASSQHQSSFPISTRRSTDRVVEKAEKHAQKTEKEGPSEEHARDRTLSAVRSPSAERSGGVAGSTLPVVEEDGESGSREESIRDDKPGASSTGLATNNSDRPPQVPEKDVKSRDARLPSIPNFNRLSMGLSSSAASTNNR